MARRTPARRTTARNKIDRFECNEDSAVLVHDFVRAMRAKPFQFSFLHFAEPDTMGHKYGWGSPQYLEAIRKADRCLGNLIFLVEHNPTLSGRTEIIVTADHGGKDKNHADSKDPLMYTIPFYVWGAEVAHGEDLYALNSATRRDPGTSRPGYDAAVQPIRNGEVANLALTWLGLEAVPGSTINAKQDLAVKAVAAGKKVAGVAFPRISAQNATGLQGGFAAVTEFIAAPGQ